VWRPHENISTHITTRIDHEETRENNRIWDIVCLFPDWLNLIASNRPFTPLSELASTTKNQFDVRSIADYLDDEELWRLAMTHSSANPVTGKNHERLEFLGDRFLELVWALRIDCSTKNMSKNREESACCADV
jgi:dsRNA-specific ribonuclease